MKPPSVILAGGRSSRMGGGDKCLLPLGGKTLIARVIDRVAPQACDILINTNSDPAPFLPFGLPVLPDTITGFQGPLAGILTGMLWSRRHHPRQAYLLTIAGDVPFLPPDLVLRLAKALYDQKADIAVAGCPRDVHPVIGLWPVDLAERLQHDLMETMNRSVQDWLRPFRVARAEFESAALVNINTPGDFELCGRHCA